MCDINKDCPICFEEKVLIPSCRTCTFKCCSGCFSEMIRLKKCAQCRSDPLGKIKMKDEYVITEEEMNDYEYFEESEQDILNDIEDNHRVEMIDDVRGEVDEEYWRNVNRYFD